ncbi:hypothetical protein BDR07DRAFT_138909 [Suillus spraguei]|nr:hypothetical protein BDR07DRAFT_138909 [Suillus spraguei]
MCTRSATWCLIVPTSVYCIYLDIRPYLSNCHSGLLLLSVSSTPVAYFSSHASSQIFFCIVFPQPDAIDQALVSMPIGRLLLIPGVQSFITLVHIFDTRIDHRSS